mmetsp:Transcript_6/g.23  ORF Transcript_6/g.23 Transcript_6/m.23 type:complete len:279 (-) Transcript_6:243-1079(-)
MSRRRRVSTPVTRRYWRRRRSRASGTTSRTCRGCGRQSTCRWTTSRSRSTTVRRAGQCVPRRWRTSRRRWTTASLQWRRSMRRFVSHRSRRCMRQSRTSLQWRCCRSCPIPPSGPSASSRWLSTNIRRRGGWRPLARRRHASRRSSRRSSVPPASSTPYKRQMARITQSFSCPSWTTSSPSTSRPSRSRTTRRSSSSSSASITSTLPAKRTPTGQSTSAASRTAASSTTSSTPASSSAAAPRCQTARRRRALQTQCRLSFVCSLSRRLRRTSRRWTSA